MYVNGVKNPEIARKLLISLPLVRILVKEVKSAWSSSSCDEAGGADTVDGGIPTKLVEDKPAEDERKEAEPEARSASDNQARQNVQQYGNTYWRTIKTDGRRRREVLARCEEKMSNAP